jgi:hypothetical protein
MPTAFEVLAKDDEQVKLTLSEFEARPTAGSDAGQRGLAQRKKVAEEQSWPRAGVRRSGSPI